MTIPNPTHAVWYASVGCLPDNGPEFIGSEAACEAFVERMEAQRIEAADEDYAEHDLYQYTVEPIDPDFDFDAFFDVAAMPDVTWEEVWQTIGE